MRSRQSISSGGSSGANSSLPQNYHVDDDKEANKGNTKSFYERNSTQLLLLFTVLCCCLIIGVKNSLLDDTGEAFSATLDADGVPITAATGDDASHIPKLSIKTVPQMAPMGKIVYGAKSKGDDTARLVKEAIYAGFRHIATGGFHNEYNEKGVGIGWKESGIPRQELYLQTLFVSNTVKSNYGTQNCNLPSPDCPPSDLSIEDQVHLSIKSSLYNLQTTYIDAVLLHNFRATLQPYEETLRAYRTLETYVDKGTIRHLGIVSVHDADYLTRLHADSRIKPTIIQNRFHSNRGYDISLRPLFKELAINHLQLFWILTGSAGGKRNNDVVKRIADKMEVSPQIVLYSFTMEVGGVPLIGTKKLEHMKDDVEALITRKIEWTSDDLVAMAGVINKDLISVI